MAFFHSPNIATEGLALALDAANPRSYPGTGTTWYDLSGRANHFNIANGTTYNSGGWFTFDGADDYMNNTSFTTTGLGNAASCVVWMRPNSSQNDGTYNGLFSYGPRTCLVTFLMSMNNSLGPTMAKWCDDFTSPTANMTSTAWWDYTLVVNGNSVNFYLNGNAAGSGNVGTSNFQHGTAAIGATDLYSRLYRGDIGAVFYYNRALTTAEMTQNYNALKERYAYQYSEGNNAAPYVGNWNNTTTYTMNQFGGLGKVNAHGWNTGPATYTLTLSSLPVHTEVRYKVFWHLVDSLDNETNQLFTMNSSGGETEKLRFTKQYNLEPAISVQDSGVIAPWSGHQTYTYRPWAGGAYGQDGYLSIDTGWYSHTANSFTARHVMGADQGQTDEAEYLSHVQVYLR
jgi:hypothetical protein